MNPKLALFAASLLVLVLTGCRSSIETRLERARQLTFAGKSVEATAEYRALLAILDDADRNDEQAQAARVESLSRSGDLSYLELRDYRSAVEAYRGLIRVAPNHEEAWAAREKLADISRRFFGDLHEAIAQWQALAASGRPDAERFAYLTAKGYFELHEYEQSRKECRDLADRAPDTKWAADALFLLGTSWQFEGKHEEAIAVFEEVEARWADTELGPRSRFQIGQAKLALDDPEGALASYLEALKRHPDPQRVQAEITRARRSVAEAQRIQQSTRQGFRG